MKPASDTPAHVGLAAMLSLGIAALLSMPSETLAQAVVPNGVSALTLCRSADQLSGSDRQRALMHGLARAEEAVAANPNDPQAHFAVFCNLGKQLQSRSIGLRDLALVRRTRRELDAALALAPADPDILAAKGAMLVALPWFLGGDTRQGEQLLRAALSKDPENAAAQRSLADALRSQGAENEARTFEMTGIAGKE
jgi:hypothetical protein